MPTRLLGVFGLKMPKYVYGPKIHPAQHTWAPWKISGSISIIVSSASRNYRIFIRSLFTKKSDMPACFLSTRELIRFSTSSKNKLFLDFSSQSYLFTITVADIEVCIQVHNLHKCLEALITSGVRHPSPLHFWKTKRKNTGVEKDLLWKLWNFAVKVRRTVFVRGWQSKGHTRVVNFRITPDRFDLSQYKQPRKRLPTVNFSLLQFYA